jgi:hypothetical protein
MKISSLPSRNTVPSPHTPLPQAGKGQEMRANNKKNMDFRDGIKEK